MATYLNDEADSREHADAAVGELGLAVAVDLELRLALEEASGVELERRATESVERTREAVREGGRLLGGRLLLSTRGQNDS